jgi:hypothetical protein
VLTNVQNLPYWLLTSYLLFSGAGRWGQLLYVSLSELLLHQLELKTEKRLHLRKRNRVAADVAASSRYRTQLPTDEDHGSAWIKKQLTAVHIVLVMD